MQTYPAGKGVNGSYLHSRNLLPQLSELPPLVGVFVGLDSGKKYRVPAAHPPAGVVGFSVAAQVPSYHKVVMSAYNHSPNGHL